MNDNGKPGLLELAASVIRAPLEERMLRMQAARHERLQVEAANQFLGEVVRRVQPENDGYIPVTGLTTRELDEATQVTLREQALRASLESDHLIGYLRSLLRFVMGKGVQLTPEIDDEVLTERINDWWKLFRKWNDWDKLEDEIPWRTWRDGELFIRRFVSTGEPPELDPKVERVIAGFDMGEIETPPEGMLLVRMVPPEHITDPSKTVSHGIVTAKNDVQTVIGYCWCTDGKTLKEFVPASEMHHIKIRVDSDVKRGRSLLEPFLKRDKQYEDWLQYRIALNLVRAAVVLVKKYEKATGEQLSSIRNAQQPTREDITNDRRQRMLRPGSVFHATGGINYEFLSPNLQAQDAQHDGRNILLSMAAAAGLPEYLFTGDSSNANYASTLVSEGPALREFEYWQDFFESHYIRLYRWGLEAASEHGLIEGLRPEDVEGLPVKAEWPPLMDRNELEHAKALDIYHGMGIMSKEGAARDVGIDWDTEKERIAAEREEAIDFMPPGMQQQARSPFSMGDDDDEED